MDYMDIIVSDVWKRQLNLINHSLTHFYNYI